MKQLSVRYFRGGKGMLAAYFILLVILICSFTMAVLGTKAEGCAKDTLQVFLVVSNFLIFIISLLGLILSCATAKVYRKEYDKLIKNIDCDKTKIIKENDEITEIYITVNGEEHHFIF